MELSADSAVAKPVNVLLSRQELGLFQWVLISYVKRYDQKGSHTFFFICGLE